MSIKIYPFECKLQWVDLDPADKNTQYESIKRAGAISYDNKTKRSAEDFVKMIVQRGHYSVLEQSNIGIRIKKHLFDNYDSELDILAFKELMLSKHLIVDFDNSHAYFCGSLRDFLNSILIYENQIEKYETWSYFTLALNDVIYHAKSTWDMIMKELTLFLSKHYPEIFGDYFQNNDKPVSNNIEFYRPTRDERRLQFYVVCSRDISHQLVRKRSSAFNQESQRYVKYDKEYPVAFAEGASNADEVREFLAIYTPVLEQCHNDYKQALNKCKYKPEIARKILNPFARTRLYICDNVAGFKEMIKLRCNSHTQPEHEWIANQIRDQMLEHGLI